MNTMFLRTCTLCCSVHWFDSNVKH